jgi:hypothetical protein
MNLYSWDGSFRPSDGLGMQLQSMLPETASGIKRHSRDQKGLNHGWTQMNTDSEQARTEEQRVKAPKTQITYKLAA